MEGRMERRMEKVIRIGLLSGMTVFMAIAVAGCSGGDGDPATDTGLTSDIGDNGDAGVSVGCQECADDQVCFEECCCTPVCTGRQCGDDGCGGSCGECDGGKVCYKNFCCSAQCTGKECGDDGCGGSCGVCLGGEKCFNSLCCPPQCDGKECGDDQCGGSCGECDADQRCMEDQACCEKKCGGRECGDDGCGGVCGECGGAEYCEGGLCWSNACNMLECGPDGYGGTCGGCPIWHDCWQGVCCEPKCTTSECGDDGCGGSCGECAVGKVCNQGICRAMACINKECGSDWAGGECGVCGIGDVCVEPDGVCCEPLCDRIINGSLYACGEDGCGGSCGNCGDKYTCVDHWCEFNPSCGDNQCLSAQGEGCENCLADCPCQAGQICRNNNCCYMTCTSEDECGDDGCGGVCGYCGHGWDCVDHECVKCTDECSSGRWCDGDYAVECTLNAEGCNELEEPVLCEMGCYNGYCMTDCPATDGACSAMGAYRCHDDLPHCVYNCTDDPTVKNPQWELAWNCSAGGPGCECAVVTKTGYGVCAYDITSGMYCKGLKPGAE